MNTDNTISLDELVFLEPVSDLLSVYLLLREQLLRMRPGMEVRVHKTQISFRAPRPFAWVMLSSFKRFTGIPGKYLVLSLASDKVLSHPAIMEQVPIRARLYTIHTLLRDIETLDSSLLSLLRGSLNLRNPI